MYQALAAVVLGVGLLAVGMALFGDGEPLKSLLLAIAMFTLCGVLGIWSLVPGLNRVPDLLVDILSELEERR